MTTPKNRLNPAFAFLTVLLAGSFWLTPNSSKATAGPGENPVQLRFAAMDAILHGNNKDALDLYETAIQEASQQYGDTSTFLADLYYEAGTAALDSSQFPVAERYLTLAVKINPYSTMAKIKLAELYRLQERPDEASKQFRQAVQINPSPVTRQAYIRWLATNGRTPQENAIATQESLKLAMLTSRSNENNRQLNLNSKGKQAATGSQMPVLPPALIAPLAKEKAAETPPATIKNDAKPKPAISLFPFKSVAKEQVLEKEKEKLEKQRKQEAAKQEAAKQEAAAKARLAEEREREHEAQLRKKASEAKAKAAAPAKKAEVKPAAAKPEEKAAPAKVEKIEKTEVKQEPKKEQPKAVEQPNVVPSPQQPSYPQTIYGVPVSVKKPTGKAARTMVPPPPPMPIFPGVQPMMRPPMPNFQAPPQQAQQQAPVTKPKPVVKPKAEVKEQPEDKPPPMTNQSESEPEFILDWGEVKPKGKKGK